MRKNKQGILTRKKSVSSFDRFVGNLQGKMCCVSFQDNFVTGHVQVDGDALYILSITNERVCVRLNVVESIVQLGKESVANATNEWLENLYNGRNYSSSEFE